MLPNNTLGLIIVEMGKHWAPTGASTGTRAAVRRGGGAAAADLNQDNLGGGRCPPCNYPGQRGWGGAWGRVHATTLRILPVFSQNIFRKSRLVNPVTVPISPSSPQRTGSRLTGKIDYPIFWRPAAAGLQFRPPINPFSPNQIVQEVEAPSPFRHADRAPAGWPCPATWRRHALNSQTRSGSSQGGHRASGVHTCYHWALLA